MLRLLLQIFVLFFGAFIVFPVFSAFIAGMAIQELILSSAAITLWLPEWIWTLNVLFRISLFGLPIFLLTLGWLIFSMARHRGLGSSCIERLPDAFGR